MGEYWGEVVEAGTGSEEPVMGALPSGTAVVFGKGTAGTGTLLMTWFKLCTNVAGATIIGAVPGPVTVTWSVPSSSSASLPASTKPAMKALAC
jgi:hypothetical protein